MSSPKISLITGANKGIGLETARQLAGLGHRVIVAARDLAKASEAAAGIGGQAEALQLDVTDAGSIARAVAAVEAVEAGRIWVSAPGQLTDGRAPCEHRQDVARGVT